MAHLPGTAGSQQLGHITVGQDGAGWNQLDQREHRLNVLSPHASRLPAVALADPVGAGR